MDIVSRIIGVKLQASVLVELKDSHMCIMPVFQWELASANNYSNNYN